jgi:hypothetical protein
MTVFIPVIPLVTFDSKREDEDPKWSIHKCDLGLWKQTTKDQFSNVQLNDDQNLEHMYHFFCLYIFLFSFD